VLGEKQKTILPENQFEQPIEDLELSEDQLPARRGQRRLNEQRFAV